MSNFEPLAEEEQVETPMLVLGDESFKCRSTIPQWQLMKLAKAYNSNDPMNGLAGMYDFINYLVLKEERERLDEYMSELDDLSRADLDSAIGDALSQMSGGRGKAPLSPSSPGSATTPATSRVVSLSRGHSRVQEGEKVERSPLGVPLS